MTEPEWWTVADCAAHCHILPGSWRDYVARGRAPAPNHPEGVPGPRWRPSTVREWHAGRPGKPGRPRKATS